MLRGTLLQWWIKHKRRHNSYWRVRSRHDVGSRLSLVILLFGGTVNLCLNRTPHIRWLFVIVIPIMVTSIDSLIMRSIIVYHNKVNKYKREAIDHIIKTKFIKLCHQYEIELFYDTPGKHPAVVIIEGIEHSYEGDPIAHAMFACAEMKNIRDWMTRYWELL